MEHHEIVARIAGIITRDLAANIEVEELSGVKRLDALLGFDSMVLLQWVAAIEREFGITIPPEKLRLDFLVDLPALAQFLRQALNEESSGSRS